MLRANRLDRLCRSARHERRGAAVVEFAIVAPIFVLLVFGMIEYDRMVMVQPVSTKATRVRTHLVVLQAATSDEVIATVVSYGKSSRVAVEAGNVDASSDPTTVATGEGMAVAIGTPSSTVSWLPPSMNLGATQHIASSRMRKKSHPAS